MKRGLAIYGLLSLVACGGTAVTTELKNIVDLTTPSALRTSEQVEVRSLQIPIRDVSLGTGTTLSGGSGNAEALYVCPGTDADACMVELVGDALENLLVAGENIREVSTGSYTFVTVATCFEENEYPIVIDASFTLGGETWYTKADSTELTLDEAMRGSASIMASGCRNYSILDTPIEIGDEPVTVDLFVDLRNIAWGNDEGESDGQHEISGAGASLEVWYPNVAGAIGATPTIERYVVSRDGEDPPGGRIVGLYFDATTDLPIGGYDRAIYDDTYSARTTIFGSFKRARVEDGSLVVTDYDGGPNDTIDGDGSHTIVGFPRLDVGQSESGLTVLNTGGDAQSYTYSVTRLD